MAATQTRQQPRAGYAQAQPNNAVATVNARLPYPLDLEAEGIDERKWRVLIDAVYPAAKTIEAVKMAINYCKARRLDVFKKPVHIVPVWSSTLRREVETVWPGISELRTTAFRTGVYAGTDEAVFGEDIREVFRGFDRDGGEIQQEVVYPSWCRITVYRLVEGQRIAFPGPRVFWRETYAKRGKADVPNDMWCKRPYGQLEKVAEAAALRKAFPEELGGEYAAEEMEGREIATAGYAAPVAEPPRPTRADFTDTASTITDAPDDVADPDFIDPLNENGGYAWKRFIPQIEHALGAADSVSQVSNILLVNAAALEVLGARSASALKTIKDAAEARAAELARGADDDLPGDDDELHPGDDIAMDALASGPTPGAPDATLFGGK